MNKKYLAVLVIAVAIAGGLYQHMQKKKAADQAAHNAKQYERMLAMAQKSPMAGLTQMGAAINKYKEAHQAYPPKLVDLYPQYIPAKAFITDIQWDYRPSTGDFYLSKSMALGGKTRLASVSSTLMPQMESAIMVAAERSPKKGKAAKPVKAQSHEEFVASMAASQALAKRQEDAYRRRYRKKKAPVIPLVSETVSFEAADEADQARANILEGRFYCWKNDDGSFGYSNVQYPDRRKVEKFNAGRWMVVQTEFNQRPERAADAGVDEIPVDSEAQALAALDRHKERDLIVWRDPNGRFGYGNVQYPRTAELEHYDAGHWTALDGQKPIDENGIQETFLIPADPPSVAEIGIQYSRDYMVWKDAAGHVGFSNVQYPQQKELQQYQEGQWVAVAPGQWDESADPAPGVEAAPSGDAVSEASNQNFIVWRDADGHIGISNVQLPTSADALEIHMDGEWLAAAR